MSKKQTLEEQAQELGRDPKLINGRLARAFFVLRQEVREKYFQKPKGVGNRLMGDGAFLEWRVRERPDEPISCSNQQTSTGVVVFELTEEERLKQTKEFQEARLA